LGCWLTGPDRAVFSVFQTGRENRGAGGGAGFESLLLDFLEMIFEACNISKKMKKVGENFGAKFFFKRKLRKV
jgi:hypothetical protein